MISIQIRRLLILISFLILNSGIGLAQEFRIESQVYMEDAPLPISQNVTVFSQGIVYDFQLSDESTPRPLEIVIYDSRQRKIVLIDPARTMKHEFHDVRLIKILESVRSKTLEDNRSSFLVKEVYEEEADWSSHSVTLTSPTITYQYVGKQPENVAVLPAYLSFIDVFTQLNATDPHKFPPFPRMRLNQSIRQLGWLPSEVKVSIKPNGLMKNGLNAKSKHVLINKLSKKDRERIALAKQHWLQFKQVDLVEYRGLVAKRQTLGQKIKLAGHNEPIGTSVHHKKPASEKQSNDASDGANEKSTQKK